MHPFCIGVHSSIRLCSSQQLPDIALAPSVHKLIHFSQSKLFVKIKLSITLKSIPWHPSSINFQNNRSSINFGLRSLQTAHNKSSVHLDCHQLLHLIANRIIDVCFINQLVVNALCYVTKLTIHGII